jgi:nitrate reductase gamma subunit
MITTILIYLLVCAAVLLFILGTVRRAVQYARAPYHLRWELYPVPHEETARAEHGGSYFEVTNWWEKPISFNLLGELKSMVPEMLFQKALWEFNRTLWFLSFPFHFGLYLLVGSTGLLGVRALLALWAPRLVSGETGIVLHYACAVGWLGGAALAAVGALSLLVRRLTDEDLKTYTTAGDLFNLLFFIVTLGCLVAGYLFRPAGSPQALALAQGEFHYVPAFRVPVVDSTGAGDIFHAGSIYGLLQGWPIPEVLRFAAAAAALKCEQLGGRPGIPTVERVTALSRSG